MVSSFRIILYLYAVQFEFALKYFLEIQFEIVSAQLHFKLNVENRNVRWVYEHKPKGLEQKKKVEASLMNDNSEFIWY